VAEAEPPSWRGIDELARLVGWYAWTEQRIFEVTGGWATTSEDEVGGDAAEVRVWCAAVSRRHGTLARVWADQLPVRAGVDAAALVESPSAALAEAFAELAALPPSRGGAAGLVEAALPGLDGVYARHLAGASPVSEGTVIEALVRGRQALAGELALQKGSPPGLRAGFSAHPVLASTLEQAFEEFRVSPAVRPS